jgi:hypothetical protein
MVAATDELRSALAAASPNRIGAWNDRVYDALVALQETLSESRRSADAEGSLLSEVAIEAPRLFDRVERLRAQYADLQRHVESLRSELVRHPSGGASDISDIRQRLGWLLAAVADVQAKESDLIYEAFAVDIGVGD